MHGSPLPVAVIGARRARQGIGAHLARFCAEAGADLVAVSGRTQRTAERAADALARPGGGPRAYADARAMVERERPRVLVIASPARTHDAYLALASERGLHALCEKPLVWGGPDPGGRARHWAETFRREGLHLVVNAQWPWTLPTYRRLHPGVLDRAPRRFFMRLSPDAAGPDMLVEALPHPLSLLAAALPDPRARVEDARVRVEDDRRERVTVRFRYVAAGRAVDCRVRLVRGRRPPRRAAYGFDGRTATRGVRMRGYRLRLEGGGRRLDLPDPTPRLVASFLERVSSGLRPRVDPAADPGTAHLAALHAAWSQAEAVPPRRAS